MRENPGGDSGASLIFLLQASCIHGASGTYKRCFRHKQGIVHCSKASLDFAFRYTIIFNSPLLGADFCLTSPIFLAPKRETLIADRVFSGYFRVLFSFNYWYVSYKYARCSRSHKICFYAVYLWLPPCPSLYKNPILVLYFTQCNFIVAHSLDIPTGPCSSRDTLIVDCRCKAPTWSSQSMKI